MAMMSGPPAKPSFTGIDIPVMWKGRLPKMIPTSIPTKMVSRLGLSSRVFWLPSFEAKMLTASSGPTTTSLSPTCRLTFGWANSSIPERKMRVTLTPCRLLGCRLPRVFPFILSRVTSICLDCIGVSCFSQFTVVSCPMNATMASASSSAHTTYILSPVKSRVSRLGTITCPSCRQREHTKSRARYSRSCRMDFPLSEGLMSSMLIRCGFTAF